MSQITSIEPQVKDKTRCSIFIDGRFYCGIKLEVAVKYRLKAGMSIEKDELDKIQLETEKAEAVDKALTHLTLKAKTEREMRLFLTKKGYVDAVVEHVIERLKYYGYVDDSDYCRQYIESVSNKSRRAIENELIKRGVDRQTVGLALEGYEDDEEKIYNLLIKYLRGKEINRENINKGCRYLVAKGYDYDAVRAACGRIDEHGDN